MCDVADARAGSLERTDKLDESHNQNKPFCLNGNDEVEEDRAVWEQHAVSEKKAKDRARTADGGREARGL